MDLVIIIIKIKTRLLTNQKLSGISTNYLLMSKRKNVDDVDKTKLPPMGEVLYIQTFQPTGQHIRETSVLEVNTPDDLSSNKLGVNSWETACGTCDSFLTECGGHEGHLEMLIPIYRIHFVKRLVDVLNSLCFYCQRSRLPPSDPDYRWISKMEKNVRLEYILSHSVAYKRCGNKCECLECNVCKDCDDGGCAACETNNIRCSSTRQSSTLTGCCGKQHITFSCEDRDSTFIRAVVPLEDVDHESIQKGPQLEAVHD